MRLVVAAGHHKGRMFEFTEHRTFLVGRAADAHLRFPEDDPLISRFHFLLEVHPQEVRLVDLGSTNGTAVNGHTVSEYRLRDGDSIEAGETRIIVFIGDDQRVQGKVREKVSPQATLVAPQRRPENLGRGKAETRNNASKDPSVDGTFDSENAHATVASTDKTIGPYKIENELGSGTFGVVYLVLRDGERFALKLTREQVVSDSKQLPRFLREIEILKRLRHRCVVRFMDAGEYGGRLFLVTEYVPGENLEQLMRRVQLLKIHSAVRIVRHALIGLSHAHSLGFVHRDIKPSNIIVNDRQVKLADFGLAGSFQKTLMSGCTLAGESGGSIGYMPPEQLLDFHAAQPTNDIYSMGPTLYRLLSGHPPYDFTDTFSHRVRMLLQSDPVPLEKRTRRIPADLCTIVNRCLTRDPGDRWQSAQELHDALERFSKRNPNGKSQPSKPPRKKESVNEGCFELKPTIDPLHLDPDKTHSRSSSGQDKGGGRPARGERICWRIAPAEALAETEYGSSTLNHTAQVVSMGSGDCVVGLGYELVVLSTTGEVRNRRSFSARIVGRPASLGDGQVVVHLEDGTLACAAVDGHIQWQSDVGEPLGWATPLVDAKQAIWVCPSTGGLRRVDAEGHCPRRAFYRSAVRLDSTALLDRSILYAGGEDGRIHAIAIDSEKGKNTWDAGDNLGRCGWFINGTIQKRGPHEIVARSGDGFLQGFSPEGIRQWRWKIPGTALADPAIDGSGKIYQPYAFADRPGGGVVCFDPTRAAELWRLRLASGVESTPVLGPDGTLYLAEVNGRLHALNALGRAIWELNLATPVRSRLTLADGGKRVMVVTEGNEVVAVRAE